MIRAVGRALAIFEAFDNDHLALSLQEIAARIRMPKTTAFRLVATLESCGYLVRMDNQQYCLSLKVARLASLVRGTLGIREIARPILMELNRQTSETVTLNAVAGAERICLDVVDSPSALMAIVVPGAHVPIFQGATGRILLAYMDEAERERLLKTSPEAKDIDRAALNREMTRFRRQGYSLSRGQRIAGMTAIAVPVFNADGQVRNCLALVGPSARLDNREVDFAEIMIAAGQDLSSRLGAHPPELTDISSAMGRKSPASSPGKKKKRTAVAAARKKEVVAIISQKKISENELSEATRRSMDKIKRLIAETISPFLSGENLMSSIKPIE